MDILDVLKHRDPDAVVAIEKDKAITASAFLDGVARWSHFFRTMGSPKTVLFCQNRIRFWIWLGSFLAVTQQFNAHQSKAWLHFKVLFDSIREAFRFERIE